MSTKNGFTINKVAIIFGINGQDGFYLKKILEQNNVEVLGVSRSEGAWMRGSVSDQNLVENVVKTHQPDFVFHLAANSSTKHDRLFENHQTITNGVINILESRYRHCPKAKIFLSGSAVQFQNTGEPIDEDSPFLASSPYALERIYSVYAGRY